MSTKKALLIGINYRGTSSALNGCINDVNSIKDHLLKNGYALNDITIMTDDTPTKPTRSNMITAILNLVMSGASKLFLHYSGHGSWERDHNADEVDRRDESLVPLDYYTAGMLTDDQLRGLLAFTPASSKLTAVLDCCHSGTGMDLAYNLRQYYRWTRVRRGRRWVRRRRLQRAMLKDRRYHNTPGQVVMLSGCLDKQYSADAYEEGKYQGAMTFCLLKALEANPNCNWAQLIDNVRALLKQHGYVQVANLTSGQPLALSARVDFC
jgi:hypothetical protein